MGKKWLLKSEPNVWSIDNQIEVGSKGADWDGVINYQAANNLKKMKKGDLCFFYHSVNEKQIVGIVKVVKEHYPDPTDKSKKFVVVDVAKYKTLKYPVSLEKIKNVTKLSHLALIKQSRLSVMPIDKKSWEIIIKMSENE